jgi:hypothetical protein
MRTIGAHLFFFRIRRLFRRHRAAAGDVFSAAGVIVEYSAALLLMLLTASTIAAAPGDVVLRFTDTAVTVEGLTAGGDVAILAVTRAMTPGSPPSLRRVTHADLINDLDGDGVVRYELHQPEAGIWSAVDVSTGRYVIAATPGYEATPIDPTDLGLKNDSAGQMRKLEADVSEMESLFVRPGEGAWHVYAAKGSERDENKNNPRGLRVDVANMKHLRDAASPPNGFKNGDVLILIDPWWMRYAALEVGK